MFIKEEEIHFLEDIGFTKTQAKLYMTLLGLEEADGRTLGEKANIPRQEVYRTLGELEKKGLVEKVISTPYKFRSTPLDLGLQILIDQRIQRFKVIQAKTKDFIRKHPTNKKETPPKQEYQLTMIEGRQRLMQIIKLQHDNAQQNVNILTTLSRWLQILHFSFENYEKALDRGVEYRIILEVLDDEILSHENIQSLLKKQNFKLRLSRSPLKTNAAFFDDKEVTINFFPSQPLAESPIIWTNHPSFISMFQDHFEKIWMTAEKYGLEN